jgi:formamidopyrimidine-DNA glycosylase
MPELPEVETVLRALLGSGIKGASISRIETKKQSHIKEISPENFVKELIGKTIKNIERKGKWLFFILDNQVLISHLRMTGKYFFEENSHSPSLIFHFTNGKKIIYCDPRGFGVFYLQSLDNYRSLHPYKEIGPDLIQEEVDVEYLFSKFQKSRLPIKSTLLEQKIMSGIGNIYASEVLFVCKINPFKPTNKISLEETKQIIHHSKKMLQRAIDLGGTSVVDFVSPIKGKGSYQNELKVYMREKKPCYECHSPIIAEAINNRNTFFCSQCQKLEI